MFDMKEKLLKIAFLMFKNPKFFACGADLPLLLHQICIIFACDSFNASQVDFFSFCSKFSKQKLFFNSFSPPQTFFFQVVALSFQSKNGFLFH